MPPLNADRGRLLPQTFRSVPALQPVGPNAAAERHYRSILKANPHHLGALHDLAVIRIGAGAGEDAIKLLRKALNINPSAAEIHALLGAAHRMLGHNEEAVARFKKAIALNPANADTHLKLGNLCMALERHEEAITAFEAAISLRSGHVHAHLNLGAAFAALGRFKEAVPHFRQVLALQPDHLHAHLNLAKALAILHQDVAAIPHYDKVIAAEPGVAETYGYKSWSLRAIGRFDEARDHLLKAIALAPNPAEFYLALANLTRFAEDDPHLARMEELLRDPAPLTPRLRWELLFGLAKAYADLGQFERSFCHLLEANTLKRQGTAYDEATVLRQLAETQALLSADFLRRHRGYGDPSAAPIFILGMPRSGTTLVEQILASHPGVFGAGELPDFGVAVERLTGADGRMAAPRAPARDWTGDEWRRLGADYVAAVGSLAPSADRITDKMPANFRFAGLIHLALPNARIIHMRRDPVDTCLSCFSILFGGDVPFAYDLAELGRYYRAYQALMAHWRAVLPPGVMIEVDYEDVVDDIEGQARRILDHCGLPWDGACLAFYQTQRSVQTSSATQVRQPIYRTSVGRWLPYKERLQPLLDALGQS
ncbi:MAG TPA: sulfotransferase [Stellaceae bacterium]|nr:sulfotransferase [Stellaceae bacterium]